MKLKQSFYIGLLMSVAAAGLSAYHWNQLPAIMPTHFDIHGHVNGYGSRWLGAALMPGLILGLGFLFAFLPRLSPEGYGLRKFETAVSATVLIVQSFLLLLHVEVLRAAMTGKPLRMGVTTFGIGALLVVAGNQFGKLRRNFFIGVRTPWTLADPEVWVRTHQLAGKLFVAAGIATMWLAVASSAGFAWIALLLTAAFASGVYSYVIYRRLHPNVTG